MELVNSAEEGNAVVLDIRSPDEEDESPLEIVGVEGNHLPSISLLLNLETSISQNKLAVLLTWRDEPLTSAVPARTRV